MPHAYIVPREMLERKAPHGQPCTSCGLCCHVQLCDMARAAFNRRDNPDGPCPALEWIDGKSRCGLLADPTKHSRRAYAVGHEIATKAAALLIDPGSGCDMSMGADYDAEYKARSNRKDDDRRSLIYWALAVWGWRVKPFPF